MNFWATGGPQSARPVQLERQGCRAGASVAPGGGAGGGGEQAPGGGARGAGRGQAERWAGRALHRGGGGAEHDPLPLSCAHPHTALEGRCTVNNSKWEGVECPNNMVIILHDRLSTTHIEDLKLHS